MSLARVYTTKGPVRKDGLTCGKCGDPIRKGVDRRVTFAVGFRGYERTRCLKPECYPTQSERESSAVSTVYAAQEGADLTSAGCYDDFIAIRDAIAEACEEVASDYEMNEMYEINYDLQERAEQVRSAGEELSNWEPENDEPVEEDYRDQECTYCDGSGLLLGRETCDRCDGQGSLPPLEEESFEDAHDAWLEETRESLQAAIDEMELP